MATGKPNPVPNAPMGRKKGSPNKITKALKEMILGALEQSGGENYLVRQAEENPAAFMTLIGKVLPLTIAGDRDSPLVIKEIRLIGVRAKPEGAP